MEVFTFAALGALITKAMSVVKAGTNKDLNGVVTQAAAWVLGVGAAFLASASEQFKGFDIGNGVLFGQLNGWALVLFGMSLASAFSLVYDFRRAFDNTGVGGAEAPLLPLGPKAPPAN